MNRLTIPKVVPAALFPLVLSCGDDNNGTSGDATSFTATLTGANEVPAVTTTATGTATFTVSGGQITYTINGINLTNA
ncbi:MAG TPA: CHRD domain-containing protein, partial [Gemmatimonadales bacterium]|nr:CHRD domain-containing protein [Gemmatimonadales bacterium]